MTKELKFAYALITLLEDVDGITRHRSLSRLIEELSELNKGMLEDVNSNKTCRKLNKFIDLLSDLKKRFIEGSGQNGFEKLEGLFVDALSNLEKSVREESNRNSRFLSLLIKELSELQKNLIGEFEFRIASFGEIQYWDPRQPVHCIICGKEVENEEKPDMTPCEHLLFNYDQYLSEFTYIRSDIEKTLTEQWDKIDYAKRERISTAGRNAEALGYCSGIERVFALSLCDGDCAWYLGFEY